MCIRDSFGCFSEESIDYPEVAYPCAKAVADGKADRGIVMCGTGIGVSIVANKVPGIRCAHVHDLETAKLTREHNDSNVLEMCIRDRCESCRGLSEVTSGRADRDCA